MIVVSDEDDPLTVATPPAKKARTASRTSAAAAAGRTFACMKFISDKTFDFMAMTLSSFMEWYQNSEMLYGVSLMV